MIKKIMSKMKEVAPKIVMHAFALGGIVIAAEICGHIPGLEEAPLLIAAAAGAYGFEPLKKQIAKLPGLRQK